jgi:E3 ubiquitin-protein ligase TRIP12
MEFEFSGEEGSGQGPTLEFYAIFSKDLRAIPNLWMKTDDNTLFPKPYEKGHKQETINIIDLKRIWESIGASIARSLADDRLIDMPFSPLFWKLVFNEVIMHS